MVQTKLIEDEGCKLCPLHETRSNIVWIRGTTIKDVDVLFVGEAPGRDEDIQGKPFVGRAGMILDKWIIDSGVTRYAIVNIVKCRPPKNRAPNKNEIKTCLPYFIMQVQKLKPKLIVALGGTAMSVLIGKTEVLSNMGKVFKTRYGDVMAFPHPSFILRGNDIDVPVDKLKDMLKTNIRMI